MRGGGTAGVADLGGMGGNLEAAQPLPTGAARLTTGFDNADKAEVGIFRDFGTVDDIIESLSVGYGYHKSAVSGGNEFAAPALKLAFFLPDRPDDDTFVQLVYEPTWNQPGSEGSSVPVATGTWVDAALDADTGLWWGTGGFGQPNTTGGPPLDTLNGWVSAFDDSFLQASLIGLSVGVGTFNQGQEGFFDNVRLAHSQMDASYDFEVAQVSEPGVLGLFGLGLIVIGWSRRIRVL